MEARLLEVLGNEAMEPEEEVEEVAAGDPAAGDPAAGDPAAGDPAAGDPAADTSDTGTVAETSASAPPDELSQA